MGRIGAKLSEEATATCRQFESQVSSIGDVTSRKMFGGFGIFHEGKMFALVTSAGRLYMKATAANQKQFDDAASERYGRMPYWRVPERISADRRNLLRWARSSISVAHQSDKNRTG